MALLAASIGQAFADTDPAGRSSEFVARYAAVDPRDPLSPKEAMPLYAARVLAGRDSAATREAVARLAEALQSRKLDPFDLHAAVHFHHVTRERGETAMSARFRDYAARWDFTKPIGVSLNYALMRDGAGLVAAETWPDLVDAAGNDAHKVHALCRSRLLPVLKKIPRDGDTEYNAPLYHGTNFMALRLLVDFSVDREIRDAARQALEFLLIDTGAHWQSGYAITSAGRAKYWGSQHVSPGSPGATTAMAWMLFGGRRDARIESVPLGFWLAYPSAWLGSIGWIIDWQRSLPVPREVRAALNPTGSMHIRKQAWILPTHGLASQRTDGTPPNSYLFKECRNVVLRWVSDKPASTFIVFQENRRRPHEKIANAFAYGENPYAQTLQDRGTVIGVYDVPDEYGFHRVIAPFTTRGAIVERMEKDGWIFAHGGTVLFAFRFTGEGRWISPDTREGLELFACDATRGGWILETSPVTDFDGGHPEEELQRFASAVAATRFECREANGTVELTYRNLAGKNLTLAWQDPAQDAPARCLVDGTRVDHAAFPRFQITDSSGAGVPFPTSLQK